MKCVFFLYLIKSLELFICILNIRKVVKFILIVLSTTTILMDQNQENITTLSKSIVWFELQLRGKKDSIFINNRAL